MVAYIAAAEEEMVVGVKVHSLRTSSFPVLSRGKQAGPFQLFQVARPKNDGCPVQVSLDQEGMLHKCLRARLQCSPTELCLEVSPACCMRGRKHMMTS